MKFVPIAVSAKFARQALLLKKNSPAIMFGAGITGGIAAAVLACKATLRVEEILDKNEDIRLRMEARLDDKEDKYGERDFVHDTRVLKVHVARDFTKLYGPSVGLGLVSIGLLTGAHITLTRRNVALAAAYTAVDQAFKKYRERVIKELGIEKDQEFRYGSQSKEIVVEGEHGHEVKTVKRINAPGDRSQYAVLFDETTNRNWQPRPEYNNLWLMNQQNFANQRLQAKGHLLLNDVYDAMGFPRTKAGCVVGWVVGGNGRTTAGDGYVDFGLFNPQTQEMYDFMQGEEGSVWIDFNVDGLVYELLDD